MGPGRTAWVVVAVVSAVASGQEDRDPFGEAAVRAATEAAIPLVEAATGWSFEARPVVEVLDDDHHRAIVRRELEALGADPFGGRPTDETVEAMRGQFTAFYSLPDGKVFIHPPSYGEVYAATFDPGSEADHLFLTIAHELVHALDAARFDLDAYRRGLADGPKETAPARKEAELAFFCLFEGHAYHVEGTIAAGQGRGGLFDRREAIAREPEAGGQLPIFLQKFLKSRITFPYLAGRDFFAWIEAHRPAADLEAVFRRPPRTTLEILVPERYFDPAPGGAAEVVRLQPLLESLGEPYVEAARVTIEPVPASEVYVDLMYLAPERRRGIVSRFVGGRKLSVIFEGRGFPPPILVVQVIVWPDAETALRALEAARELEAIRDRAAAGQTMVEVLESEAVEIDLGLEGVEVHAWTRTLGIMENLRLEGTSLTLVVGRHQIVVSSALGAVELETLRDLSRRSAGHLLR